MKLFFENNKTIETNAYLIFCNGELIDVRIDATDYIGVSDITVVSIDCTGEIVINFTDQNQQGV